MRCDTVTIKTDKGDVVINKSDYDAKKHTLAGAKPAKKAEPKAEKPKAAKTEDVKKPTKKATTKKSKSKE